MCVPFTSTTVTIVSPICLGPLLTVLLSTQIPSCSILRRAAQKKHSLTHSIQLAQLSPKPCSTTGRFHQNIGESETSEAKHESETSGSDGTDFMDTGVPLIHRNKNSMKLGGPPLVGENPSFLLQLQKLLQPSWRPKRNHRPRWGDGLPCLPPRSVAPPSR